MKDSTGRPSNFVTLARVPDAYIPDHLKGRDLKVKLVWKRMHSHQ